MRLTTYIASTPLPMNTTQTAISQSTVDRTASICVKPTSIFSVPLSTAAQTIRSVNMLVSKTAASAATAIAQTSTTPSRLPPSTIAGKLSQWLFGKAELPSSLNKYGSFLLLITGGAAAASALTHIFQKNKHSREKVQIAIFHIVRMLENLPDLEARLQDPQNLIAQIEAEVTRMVVAHISKAEGKAAMKEMKRKIWTYVDKQREGQTKCRKVETQAQPVVSAAEPKRNASSLYTYEEDLGNTAQGIDVDAQSVPAITGDHGGTEELEQEDAEEDISMLDIDDDARMDIPTMSATPPAPEETSAMPELPTVSPEKLPGPVQPPSEAKPSYQYPSSQISDEHSPSLIPPPPPEAPTPRRGYGFTYDDDDCTSSSSDGALPTHPNWASGTSPRPQAIKPISIFKSSPPPNTMAYKTCNEKKGTWLGPLMEGDPPQASPYPGTTEYRVAETRIFYNKVVQDRTQRRLKPKVEVEEEKENSPPVTNSLPITAASPAVQRSSSPVEPQTPEAPRNPSQHSEDGATPSPKLGRRQSRKSIVAPETPVQVKKVVPPKTPETVVRRSGRVKAYKGAYTR